MATLKDKLVQMMMSAKSKIKTGIIKSFSVYPKPKPKTKEEQGQEVLKLERMRQIVDEYIKKNPKFKLPSQFKGLIK